MQNQTPLALGQHRDSSELLPEITPDNRVDARSLHQSLDVRTRFDDWIRARVIEFGFMEGEDFTLIFQENPSGNGRPRKDYLLTLDMAKELAMVERNEAGRRVRRYFIEVEKRAREAYARSRNTGGGIDAVALSRITEIHGLMIQEMTSHAQRIAALEESTRPGPEWLTVREWLDEHRPGTIPRCMTMHSPEARIISGISTKASNISRRRQIACGYTRRNHSHQRTYRPDIIAEAVTTWEAGQ